MIETVLVFEGQGARTIPSDVPGAAPIDLATLSPVEAQRRIVTHQIDRAQGYLDHEPCAVLGQSLGEISALVAAGALERDDALDVVRLRVELVDALLEPGDWVMASLTRVDPDAVRGAADALGLWVVSENGPTDRVVVGRHPAFQAFTERLDLTDEMYLALPVTRPYHTPLMAPVAEALATELERVPFVDPVRPMISPTGPRWVADAATARATVVDALVSPVRWSASLAFGTSHLPQARWRECGPGGFLARFTRKNGMVDLDWAQATPFDIGRSGCMTGTGSSASAEADRVIGRRR